MPTLERRRLLTSFNSVIRVPPIDLKRARPLSAFLPSGFLPSFRQETVSTMPRLATMPLQTFWLSYLREQRTKVSPRKSGPRTRLRTALDRSTPWLRDW